MCPLWQNFGRREWLLRLRPPGCASKRIDQMPRAGTRGVKTGPSTLRRRRSHRRYRCNGRGSIVDVTQRRGTRWRWLSLPLPPPLSLSFSLFCPKIRFDSSSASRAVIGHGTPPTIRRDAFETGRRRRRKGDCCHAKNGPPALPQRAQPSARNKNENPDSNHPQNLLFFIAGRHGLFICVVAPLPNSLLFIY